MRFSFKDGHVYHVHSDEISLNDVKDLDVRRVSTIEWSKERKGFVIHWHPLVIEHFRLLLTPATYPTKQVAVEHEIGMLDRIQAYPEAASVFDKLIDSQCSLADYQAI